WIICSRIIISTFSTASSVTCQTIIRARLAHGLLILSCSSQIVSILALRATIAAASQAVGRACNTYCLIHLRGV
ncbi:MAG: hypothetical protein ACK55Z_02390, partial [bacterium]